MKALFKFFMAAIVLCAGCTFTASAETKEEKQAAKEMQSLTKEMKNLAKEQAKQRTKDKWKLIGSSMPMEYVMAKHLIFIEEDPDHVELTGTAVAKNPKIGKNNAIMDALATYASRAEAQITGNVRNEASANATSEETVESDIFVQNYATNVKTKIAGMVNVSYILAKENKDGTTTYEAFLTYDEKDAKKARAQAAMEAMQQSGQETLNKQLEDLIAEPVK